MFFFPFRTDRRLQHVPWVNLGLILVNVLIFMYTSHGRGLVLSENYRLDPVQPALYQFITYQFLHANLLHLAGNMLFLWVFGNSVEDRLGKVGYLAFYLAGGVVAGLGHTLMVKEPVLGASGSICAVTGAYLALFPLSNITIFYWFFFYPGVFEISSMLLILIQILQNVGLEIMGSGDVAYLAHLSGYTYGFLVGMGLLASGLLIREPYDLFSMVNQYRRRREFRRLTRAGYRPWEFDHNATPPPDMTTGGAPPGNSPAPGNPGTPGSPAPGGLPFFSKLDIRNHKSASPSELKSGILAPRQEQILAMRSQITQAITSQNLEAAADLYARLLDVDAGQVLGRQAQLDLANQLLSMGRQVTAAQAYELFLNTFRNDPQRQEIELLLGLLYTRYLNRRQRARELLTAAIPRLQVADQRTLAQQLLAEIAG